ncbi:MAG: hypothetical protein SEPTF4163_004227 [Sporothrix epigloea]
MAPSKPRANADDAHNASGHGLGLTAAAASLSFIAGASANVSSAHSSTHHATTNGKARRTVASALQWNDFERGVLHGYTRAFKLDEAGAFSSEFAQWILSQPGSVGLQSPTMQRRRDMRRQSKTRLASAVRKHFNSQGGQENDIVVDFLHKIQTQEVVRQRRPRRMGSNAREIDG